MKINALLAENNIIPPGSDEADDMDNDRWDAIHAVEMQIQKQQYAIFRKANVPMDDIDGIPVIVNFDEDSGMVEVIVTADEISVQSLIVLSEAGAILPTTMITTTGDQIDITTNFPAAQTPFKQFMQV